MRFEFPQLTKCCFCLPLRRGLLTWGYIKWLGTIITEVFLVIILATMHHYPSETVEIVILALALLLLTADIIFGLILIISLHIKNYKFLKIYVWYSVVVFVLLLIQSLCVLSLYMDGIFFGPSFLVFLDYLGMLFAMVFLILLAHIYQLILVKSVANKLEQNTSFKFYNNLAEPECVMHSEEGLAQMAV